LQLKAIILQRWAIIGILTKFKEEHYMVTYMMLMNLTDQGIKDVKGAPERIEVGLKAYEKFGGKVIGFWIAVGKYDYVSIGESDSDEAALAWAVALSSQGNVKVESVKLFSKEQFAGIIKMLP
jgi:uncharacterized protein with GYD domain